MKNKLKVIALVAVVVIGMVLYKKHFARKEKKDEKEKDTSRKASVRSEKNRSN